MDLMVYGSCQQLLLVRTMSWQKVATIPLDAEDVSMACWSPSGRWIASLASENQIQLYGVELLANPHYNEAPEPQHTLAIDDEVKGLYWAHVGRLHPTAHRVSRDEEGQEITWSYQSTHVDKTKFILPPSGYLFPEEEDDHHHRHHDQTTTTALPESKTPLSVLCVSTVKNIELYLHGRYRFLQIPQPDASKVVMSNDLSYLIAQSDPCSLSVYHLPFLKRDRYPLQIVASLHASITAHLTTLKESIVECANSWKSSLKALDMKLQPLQRLLQNYGVDDMPLGAVLKQYILVGHTSESASVANAIDQFFTGVQMNDQLVQRMERSLHGALANVESQARKGILSPMQALCRQVHELSGHMRYHSPDDTAPDDLIRTSSFLWISVHGLLFSIVEGRCLVRDFCAWLRSAGSQVKARGTAPNSVQRENAKKRRVTEAILQDLLSRLNTEPMDTNRVSSITEHLLKINTSFFLEDTEEEIPLPNADSMKDDRPESPLSVISLPTSTPTVAEAVKRTAEAFEKTFENPLSNIPETLHPQEIELPLATSRVALHMRIGGDDLGTPDFSDDEDEDDQDGPKTYFAPRVACEDGFKISYCRQWSLIASIQEKNTVQLFAIPLGWKDPDCPDLLDDMESEDNTPFYLTTIMALPDTGCVRDVAFYSDDGKSTLASGNDCGSGKEGSQKLGILFQEEDRLDIWLVRYDDMVWQTLEYGSKFVDASTVDELAKCELKPIKEEQGDALEDDGVRFAQTRTIPSLEDPSAAVDLILCGSRGVGAVTVGHEKLTTIELLDLEEDEEPDDEDEYEDE